MEEGKLQHLKRGKGSGIGKIDHWSELLDVREG